jgi:2,4-dienoyl-CoA reductase-like NADH-dependent reductase (Old Yellow Enzyme family)
MSRLFPHLFSPIELGGRTLRNRIVFGAHTANMAEGGLPTVRHAAYYAERAIGGAAMIVVEPMPVHPAAVLTRGHFRPCDDSVIPHFKKVASAIKDNGAVAIQQLYHVGAHGDSDNSFHPHWSPSGLPSYHDSDGSHPMSEAEIWETIDGFVQAARRCQEAGFDGVEVWAPPISAWSISSGRHGRTAARTNGAALWRTAHGCHGRPSHAFGQSADPTSSLASPSVMSRVTASRSPERSFAEIVGIHDELELIDYVTCGSDGYLDFHKLMPTFLYPEKLGADLSTALKRTVKKALVIAESHIRTPENAETVLGEGAADLVSIVRGQIADPHLARKAGEDYPDDIRGCISWHSANGWQAPNNRRLASVQPPAAAKNLKNLRKSSVGSCGTPASFASAANANTPDAWRSGVFLFGCGGRI